MQVTALGDGEYYTNSSATAQSEITVNSASVTISVVRADGEVFAENNQPVITLTMADGTTTIAFTNGETKPLPLGQYAKTDEFTVSGESQSIEVSLEAETFQVTFNVQPDGAKIVVRSEAGEEVAPTQESASIYSLPNGKWSDSGALQLQRSEELGEEPYGLRRKCRSGSEHRHDGRHLQFGIRFV